ncbi:hypothetical protein TSAR_009661 [Trichomalopsis sarcophagae]|uniref:Uncharacterized protein n=1 Tax=Trichomalopsis sarcophagae TaxID=543379 RepID=A0A232ELP3_9HYME|nr:hypothetical protein TSAR_009661 [Trichomalopsis sarcophagae]
MKLKEACINEEVMFKNKYSDMKDSDGICKMSLFDEDFFTDIEDEMLAIKEGKFLVNEKDDSFFDYCDNNLNDKLQIKFKKCEDITKNTILDQLVYDEETKTVNESLFQ